MKKVEYIELAIGKVKKKESRKKEKKTISRSKIYRYIHVPNFDSLRRQTFTQTLAHHIQTCNI